jgi:Domain of unknown function (DUF4158)
VATRVFSDEELEGLRSFPDVNREELIRFFTLTPADVTFIDPGRGRDRPTGWAWRCSCACCRSSGLHLTRPRRRHRLRPLAEVGRRGPAGSTTSH